MNELDPTAAQELVKLACQKISEDKRAKVAASFAGVSESVWSHYGGLDHMNKNLPMWRALLIQQRSGRSDFSRLLDQVTSTGATDDMDPRRIAGSALTLLAALTTGLNEALDDDELTEAERRQLMPIADRLCDEGARLKARLSANVTILRKGA